ncbi:undecaprenyl/decaprenyl-phosphate alpha-N-acetylglucosaminyl 1-phosphate transferase [bacterium]|nr:undecaprenyl/decaprenyl-phosphate alpha-N-acetylglucosaminyl 1-phosphate transferase [bacterium]
MLLYVFSFSLSFLISLYITPRVRDTAVRLNIVDMPDNDLKRHEGPVPYMGGMAIFISFIVTLAFTFDFSKEVLALLLAGSIVFITGVIDDLKVISPGLKLIGQCLAILALMKAGIMIRLKFIPIWIGAPLTFFWLIGITNAFNLIDIMDGLSGGVAFIICSYLFLVARLNGRIMIAVMTISLGGSILGFLRWNFHPAKIYLGDAGSLFIGLMTGALAMIGSYTDKNLVSTLSPVLILGVPIFDTLFVSYIRFRRGQSIFLGSNDHFALRLRHLAMTPVQVVMLSYLMTICLGGAGIWMIYLSNTGAFAVLLGASAVLFFIAYLLKKIDMSKTSGAAR